ncbi:MAG TPA: carbon monoxide dehydrogenase subunit G [Euzebyales bacterium]
MKVNGSHVVHAPRQRVWDALQDPAVLVRTIPGCQELAEAGDDTYTARVHAGIASIKGIYDGEVQLTDQDPPNSYTLRATGSGGPGTIDATAVVTLVEDGDATRVDYDAHAVIGGPIAGVGQRVVVGVAKRNAKSFFDAVDGHLADRGEPAVGVTPDAEDREPATGAPTRPGPRDGVVHYRPPEPPRPISMLAQLLSAALVGAAIALAGVAVGQRRRT